MPRKILVIVLAGVAVVGVAVALWIFWPFGGAQTLRLYGIVEIQEVRLGSKVGGRVAKIDVYEGQLVQPGRPLVYFDEPELEKQRDQWAAKLQAARTELARTEKSLKLDLEAARETVNVAQAEHARAEEGWREEEKKIARHEQVTAETAHQLAVAELGRLKTLRPTGGVSTLDYDRAVAAEKQTKSQMEAAQTKVAMQKRGGWLKELAVLKAKLKQAKISYDKLEATKYEIVKAAKVQVEDVEAKLAEIDVNLKEAIVRAPERAVVDVVAVRKGDLVAPNQPVVRVLRAEDLWVKIFVPETELGKLRLNQNVEVLLDAYPSHRFQGTIRQIGTISEFTPRNVQSVEERHYQLFPIKIRVDDPQGIFRAGLAATVLVPLEPAP